MCTKRTRIVHTLQVSRCLTNAALGSRRLAIDALSVCGHEAIRVRRKLSLVFGSGLQDEPGVRIAFLHRSREPLRLRFVGGTLVAEPGDVLVTSVRTEGD